MSYFKNIPSRNAIAMLVVTVIALGVVFLEVTLFVQALSGML